MNDKRSRYCHDCRAALDEVFVSMRDPAGRQWIHVCESCAERRRKAKTDEALRTIAEAVKPTVRKDRKQKPTEFKRTGPTYVKVVDASQGIVESIVSVYGVTDLYNDVMVKGVFAKSLKERGPKIRVLDAHDTDSTMAVVGISLELKEVTRAKLPEELLEEYPEATGGLYARTQFLLDTERGREVFNRIKAGAIDEWSIGFDIIQAAFRDADEDEPLPVRDITEGRLWEYSPVIWGANPATFTLEARAARRREKQQELSTDAVPAMQSYPLAPRARGWDAGAAVQRWRGASDSGDAPSARYRNGFMWFDADSTDQFTAYKLPYVDVIDGRVHAIPRGLFAIAGRLDGTDIPDADKATIRRRLSAWYARMRDEFDDPSIVPPWEQSAPENHELLTAISHAANLLDELLVVADRLVEQRRMITLSIHMEDTTLAGLTPEQLDRLLDGLMEEMTLRGMVAEQTEDAGPPDDETQAPTDEDTPPVDTDAGPPDDETQAPTDDAALAKDKKQVLLDDLRVMGMTKGGKNA